MIHKVVLNKDREAVLKRKFREGDIVVLTDDTSERTLLVLNKSIPCENCPLGMYRHDAVKCHMAFHYKHEGTLAGNLPCNADFLDGYDKSKPGASSYPISYKQIDSLLEDL